MAKTGRKSSYDTVIMPNIERIKELLAEGYSEKSVADTIGVSYSTWKKYKSKIAYFTSIVLTAREKNIKEIERSMYRKAIGFKTSVKKAMKIKEVTYNKETGKKLKEIERIEFYEEEIYIPPSEAAGAFLLKNWAKDSYSNNPAELEQKKEEFEHRRTIDEW